MTPEEEKEMEALTLKWAEDIGGKDVRVVMGACLNIVSTVGLHVPHEHAKVFASYLYRVADEMATPSAERCNA